MNRSADAVSGQLAQDMETAGPDFSFNRSSNLRYTTACLAAPKPDRCATAQREVSASAEASGRRTVVAASGIAFGAAVTRS